MPLYSSAAASWAGLLQQQLHTGGPHGALVCDWVCVFAHCSCLDVHASCCAHRPALTVSARWPATRRSGLCFCACFPTPPAWCACCCTFCCPAGLLWQQAHAGWLYGAV